MRPGTSRGADDANDTVVADAVYIVKVEGFTDAVTWAPALLASGTYQVYAKWTSDETRATDALYRIAHAGGTAEVSMNQRVCGGLWQYLGSYAFDPVVNPAVTLVANDNGSVAADAVRFVGGPGGAADIAYLHSDHLGTPQAMTDANGQLLWWRGQTPFGQTVAEGGFSASPLRFPGQYVDAESGLNYNYFRDYDPALGRYLSADPKGLRGGFNLYTYVNNTPIRYSDPRGLTPAAVVIGIGVRVVGGRAAAGAIGAGARSLLGPTAGGIAACVLVGVCTFNEGEEAREDKEAPPRGLPPEGITPPTEGECKPGPASRPSERDKGGQSLWDPAGGEWRWYPEDRWHNPHWDYNPHNTPNSPWQNIPHGGLPPRK